MKTLKTVLFAATAVSLAAVGAAHAESLADAIGLAYQTNPNLQSQRAQLRALDESYVQARSNYRPSLNLTLGETYARQEQFIGAARLEPQSTTGSLGISASQLLYDFGRTAASISVAEADILAGREQLRAVEGSILLDVIQAYAAVRRDQQLLDIRRQTVEAYQAQSAQIDARLRRGDVTRTDLGQVEAQLALARATYAQAEAQLQFSRAAYAALVGQNPGQLEAEPTLVGLPGQITEAFEAVETSNPTLLRAVFSERSATRRIGVVAAAYGPTLGVSTSIGYDGPLNPYNQDRYARGINTSVTLSQPLFAGGFTSSTVRAARENAAAQRSLVEAARRDAVQRASQAWNQMVSAKTQQRLAEEGIRGARTSVEGSRLEYGAGLRSTLELLIEQQRLRDLESLAVQARYNDYVAQAQLIYVMGRMDIAVLTDGVPAYDPAANFNRVRNKGMLPTDPLIEGLNTALSPKPALAPEPVVQPLQATITPATVQAPANASLVTEVPTAPLTQVDRDAIGDLLGRSGR